jgi:hypothetical protein
MVMSAAITAAKGQKLSDKFPAFFWKFSMGS